MIRRRLPLDGTWQFATDPTDSLAPDTLAAAELRDIQVPGPWQAQFDDLRDYSGVAWYRRTFALRASAWGGALPPDPVYLVHFGAVDYHATVWLNGTLLGAHEGGYLPFELDASRALRLDGTNELVLGYQSRGVRLILSR